MGHAVKRKSLHGPGGSGYPASFVSLLAPEVGRGSCVGKSFKLSAAGHFREQGKCNVRDRCQKLG
jgi:hypothetical protein